MTVISSTKDAEALSLVIVAEFDATTDRVWQIWENPRQLEQWWGPPTWPASFPEYNFTEGGDVAYYMTGPDGSKAHGWWKFTQITPENGLELDDGFANEDGSHVTEMGTSHMVVSIESIDDQPARSRMSIRSQFESAEQLEKMIEMGMQEGMGEAMGQIDAILAADS
ncbi:SRPBCC family protein [Pseudarthrobacter sp. J1738]|uniref:SRPBCC family protein n=1 Tax=Pseudarthrobacter sp. J1738 TaxID=3420446 RepID=UPI003D2E7C55